MNSLIAKIYRGLFSGADRLNRQNILELVAKAREGGGPTALLRILDLGCDDGSWTSELGRVAGSVDLHGVEIVPEQAETARMRGIKVVLGDLNAPLSLPDSSYDVVHANQVIEHVGNIDLFTSEVHRVLRPGGLAVISTENGSAWHNIFAAVMGWQIFSLTNVSGRAGAIGNPLALHRGNRPFSESWTHKTIFNYRGLKELFEVHGFCGVEVFGSGYHPLPPRVGRWDPRHAHFLTVGARKASNGA